MADYNSDRTGSNIDLTLDKVDALDAKVQPTATGANVTGTLVTDGLTVDGIARVDGNITIGRTTGSYVFTEVDGGSERAGIHSNALNDLNFKVNNSITAMNISGATRDVSFYEDTGTTAKMVWSSSAESLTLPDLKVSGGVYLGGTGAANKLDDYETGTWTPVVEGTTVTGTGTYVGRNAGYTKIGNLVHVWLYINQTGHSGSGNMVITGLPFTTSSSGAIATGGFNFKRANGNPDKPANTVIQMYSPVSSASIVFESISTSSTSAVSSPLALDINWAGYISGIYYTDA